MHSENENRRAKVGAMILTSLIVGVTIGHVLPRSMEPMPMSHLMPNGSNMSNTMSGMTMSLQGKTGDAFDRAFIEEMIVHHEGAVDMAELALLNAGHAEVKKLARDIITAQTGEITMMRGWLGSWYQGL